MQFVIGNEKEAEMNVLLKSVISTVAALALLAPAAAAADRPDDRAGARGPGAVSQPVLPGDTPVPFWPHETGVLVGTSETYAEVREDGSYVDLSHGRRVSSAQGAVSAGLPAEWGGSAQRIIAQERGRRSDARLFSPSGSASIQVVGPNGRFNWSDAGIGAGVFGGVMGLVLAGMLAVRHGRRRLRHA